MSKSFLCPCGSVIDERSHPIPDIGGIPYGDQSGGQSACPLCGAERHLLKPCICEPQPSILQKSDASESALLAQLADYEAHLCESNRFMKSQLTKEMRPHTRLLRRIGYTAATPDPGEVIDDAAYTWLLKHSANYYWFCRILAAAAAKSDKLPIGTDEIEQGIDEVISQLGTEFIESGSLTNFSHWETANGVIRGALLLERVADGTCRLVPNDVYGKVPWTASAARR